MMKREWAGALSKKDISNVRSKQNQNIVYK